MVSLGTFISSMGQEYKIANTGVPCGAQVRIIQLQDGHFLQLNDRHLITKKGTKK